jgi:hypothetical protein
MCNLKGLEHKSSTLSLLVTTQFEVLATLDGKLHLVLALGAFQTEHNLLGGLGLFNPRQYKNDFSESSATTINGISHLIKKNHHLPSCGRRAWFDHHNRIAYGRNVSYLEQRERPYQPCIGSPCEEYAYGT